MPAGPPPMMIKSYIDCYFNPLVINWRTEEANVTTGERCRMAKRRAISRRKPKRGRPKKWPKLLSALDAAGLMGGAKDCIVSDRELAQAFVKTGSRAIVETLEERDRHPPGE